MNNEFEIKRLSSTVLRVDIPFKVGQRHSVMLSSDWHWDNPHTNRELLKKDLNRAKEENMMIIGAGDIFCAMQGKGDRRHNKADVRPEHMVGNYLDALSETHVDWIEPWAKNLLMYSYGNHETAVLNHKEADLITKTIEGIYYQHNHRAEVMPYAGWIFFRFFSWTKAGKKLVHQTVRVAYTHGHGGGGIVTKGTLWPTRRSVFLPDADVVFCGHVHEKWVFPIMQEKVDANGVSTIKEQSHVQLPTYKEEYLSGNGYHREKGRPPKPLGCWYMHMDMKRVKHPVTGKDKRAIELDFETSVKNIIF